MVLLGPRFSSVSLLAVVQGSTDDLQFGMLVVHCRFHVSVAHRLHHSGQVPVRMRIRVP